MLQCMLGRGIVERTRVGDPQTQLHRREQEGRSMQRHQQEQALFAATQQHRQRAVEKQWLEEQKQWAEVMVATISLG